MPETRVHVSLLFEFVCIVIDDGSENVEPDDELLDELDDVGVGSVILPPAYI